MWVNVGDTQIKESKTEKLLGAHIDKSLKFDMHVSKLCSKVSTKVTILARISKHMTFEKRRILLKSFIESQFSYCPLVWMFHGRISNGKINRIYERALRIVYKDYTSTFEDLLEKDKSFTVHHRNIQRLAMELYKFHNSLSPEILADIFVKKQEDMPFLRSQQDFHRPFVKHVNHGDDSLRAFDLVPKSGI